MMQLTTDWHIHTLHSCDSASLPMAEMAPAAARHGLVAYGITDHIHTPFNLPDLVASRAAWEACDPAPSFHFGVEVSSVSQWELHQLAAGLAEPATYGLRSGGPAAATPAIGISAEQLAELHVEYVVAGTHWPLYVPLEAEAVTRDYHRQNMFLVTHPLVDVVAHPWWWHGHWQRADGVFATDPWFDDFDRIPASMHDEFAAAAVEHGTAVEANVTAVLVNRAYPEAFRRQYADYLAGLHARGVTLSLGSDCHAPSYDDMPLAEAAALLAAAGLDNVDWWRLPDRTTNKE
jgi:histidinol phosphatase-like PHP family hydrolase